MTLPRTIVSVESQAQPRRTLWRTDMIETVKLAWPIALTQLGQIAMMTTDLALIGRLGEHAIAAVGLAHLILFVGFVLGMGPVSAVAPLAAQAFGARKPRLVRRSLRVGLWAAVIIGIPVNVAQLWGEELLVAAGQSSETAALAARYLAGLTWSMIPAWCFIAFRNFMGAVNRPEPALAITLAAIPANGLLAYALIYGAFGLPRLDLLGAGLATTFVNAAMCMAAIWVCYTRRPFRKYRVLGRFWRADWELMRKLLTIGLPISGGFMLEWGLFSSAALLVGWIGTTALAAHQIALQVAAVLFMIPFGISLAATVRVGHAVGRRDPVAARRAGCGALALGTVFMTATTAIIVALRHDVPLLFIGDQTDAAGTADSCRHAASRRRDLLRDRRRAGHCRRRLARFQRHASANGVCRDQLLADRLSQRLWIGFHGRPRRSRHLDRILDRRRYVRPAAGLAVLLAVGGRTAAVGRPVTTSAV